MWLARQLLLPAETSSWWKQISFHWWYHYYDAQLTWAPVFYKVVRFASFHPFHLLSNQLTLLTNSAQVPFASSTQATVIMRPSESKHDVGFHRLFGSNECIPSRRKKTTTLQMGFQSHSYVHGTRPKRTPKRVSNPNCNTWRCRRNTENPVVLPLLNSPLSTHEAPSNSSSEDHAKSWFARKLWPIWPANPTTESWFDVILCYATMVNYLRFLAPESSDPKSFSHGFLHHTAKTYSPDDLQNMLL